MFSASILLPVAALAAPPGIAPAHGGLITEFHGTPAHTNLRPWHPPAGSKVIFNTLGKTKRTYSYNTAIGWDITNPGSLLKALQWVAYPITPTENVTLTEIDEAVSIASGKSEITVALLADKGGLPGATLTSKAVKGLQQNGNCCAVATARVAPVKLKAGTTYWVAATLPSKQEATTYDVWAYSTYNTGKSLVAFYGAHGWDSTETASYAAFAAYGQ